MSLGKRRGEGESNWDSTGGYDSKRMMMSGAAGGVPGGYGMQGAAAIFVHRIDGSPSNVIGLPLDAVAALVRRVGIDLFDFSR